MEYGITANGFSMRRLDEIYNASCKRFEDEIGVNPSENPQSVMNVLFTIFSDAPAEMWEAFAASYQQLYPNTAEGIALDNAMQIGGVNRTHKVYVVLHWARGNDNSCRCAGSVEYVSTTSIPSQRRIHDFKCKLEKNWNPTNREREWNDYV